MAVRRVLERVPAELVWPLTVRPSQHVEPRRLFPLSHKLSQLVFVAHTRHEVQQSSLMREAKEKVLLGCRPATRGGG